MKIDSKPYGEVEIDPDKTVTLVDGLFGFEDNREFAILGRQEEQPFEWLQSVDDPSLAFVICRAYVVKDDYKLSLLQEDYDDIGYRDEDDVVIYTIVVVPDDPQDMTVNLRGPIVINQRNYQGKQVINQIEEYGVKHKLLDELEDQSVLQTAGQGPVD